MNISLSLTKTLDTEAAGFLKSFLATFPENLAKNIMLKSYPANYTLISTDDTCPFVYILLKGRLQAIEEHSVNEPYNYTELSSIDIVGDFELFIGSNARAVTLITLEKSLCLIIPSAEYLSWIQKDSSALFIRSQMLIRQLMTKTRFDRQNLFLDNRTRLLYYLYSECSKSFAQGFPLKITDTRPDIADKLGCSLRTVNRTISSLHEARLLTLKHGKIVISDEQFKKIKDLVSCNSN